ncbi:MAG: M13 family metallopeptidase [Candidatus Azobacteroides sp.]|nr:M13 family metallopeptidase [Candidatus Azobacteroides sp.]
MKRLFYLMALIMLTAACKQVKQETLESGITLANLDTTVVSGDNFYRYACGGWIDRNPLTPEHSRFGTFDELRENAQKQVRGLIESLSQKKNPQGSIPQKIGDLFVIAMDSVRLNQEKAEPLKAYLQNIDSINDKSQLNALLANLIRDGLSSMFFLYVGPDDKNSSMNILHTYQGGMSMGDRDYYLDKDKNTENIRAKYIETIQKLFILAGYSEVQAKEASDAVMKIETRLATVAYPRAKLRDPEINYNKVTLAELEKKAPNIDWNFLFKNIGLKNVEGLNLSQPEPVAEVSKILEESSLQELKYYFTWGVINASSGFLSDDFINASFEFYGKTLSGKKELRPRWKRAVDAVNDGLGEAVGQMYVEKYFPPVAKKRMLGLVHNLQVALGERINALPWMGDSTKIKAQEKLNAFRIKIGYPDKWRDYSGLEINSADSYFVNAIRSNNFDFDYMISKFNKPVDKDEWQMTPQTVNAYYSPETNEICFPAGILQPPFFNMKADDAVNYGAIGVVIGHEMTHGFDDQGRLYDKEGNLNDWWTADDAKRFEERAEVLIRFFDNIIVIDTIHANGHFTLGENIADQGGLQVSWQAYQNSLAGKTAPVMDGFTGAQRFFIGYGTVWAGNIRDEEIRNLTKIDPHSLSKWRVNAALPQIDAWYTAFNITPENKLFVPKEDRVFIW